MNNNSFKTVLNEVISLSKLDWKLLSIVKNFSDSEKLEFTDYIITPVQKEISEEFINTDDLKFSDKMNEEELENLIEEISKNLGK